MEAKGADKEPVDRRWIGSMHVDAAHLQEYLKQRHRTQDAPTEKTLDVAASEFHNREMINWRRMRSIIEHENLLVNHRMTWLLTSQTILFAAYGVLYISSGSNAKLEIVLLPLISICVLSIAICCFISIGLRNAQIQIDSTISWWYWGVTNPGEKPPGHHAALMREYDDLNSRHPPVIFGADIQTTIHHNWSGSRSFSVEILPLIFAFIWSVLLAWGIVRFVVDPSQLSIWATVALYVVFLFFAVVAFAILGGVLVMVGRSLERNRKN
jgi:hypothetical protein